MRVRASMDDDDDRTYRHSNQHNRASYWRKRRNHIQLEKYGSAEKMPDEKV